MHKRVIGAALAVVLMTAAISPVAMAADRCDLLQQGDKDGSVYTLQQYLAKKGLLDASPTGYYGDMTAEAVSDFQDKAGLTVDGVAGPQTLSKLMGDAYNGITYTGNLKTDSLQNGDNALTVGDVQRRLMELGYADFDEITSYYGSMTEDAVSRFQRANKLKVDGVAGPSTLQRMFSSSAAEYSLNPNDEGNDIITLQKRLAELNYFDKDTTGYYGSYTEQAVSDFQKRNNLTVDGVAGPKTLDKIYSPDAKEASSASSSTPSTPSTSSSTKPKETKKASSSNNDADSAVALALSKVGCRYVWSTEGPNTFDCSGLVYYMLNNSGVSVSRLNAAGFAQESSWDKITSIGDLKKGDLVFFRSPSSSRICHVAIYIGNGQIVHAATSKTGVKVSDLSSYYQNNFVLGRRPNY